MGNKFFKNLMNKKKVSTVVQDNDGEKWYAKVRVLKNEFRIAVVGAGGVGKSCLSLQFVSRTFVEEYDPTIEDSFRKQIPVGEEAVMLDILDTAGQDEYKSLRDQWMRDREGFIVVFSVDNSKSWDEIPKWLDSIFKTKDNDAREGPIIIVANKMDMEDQRVVNDSQMEEFSKKYNLPIMKVSAKTRLNVDELFEKAILECKKYRIKWGIEVAQY